MTSRTAVTTTPITTPVSAATNHLTSNGAVYDAAGNLTEIAPPNQPNTYVYVYDPLNSVQKTYARGSESLPRYFIYTADDERLWTYDGRTNTSRWTLRDLGGKVLRDYTLDSPDGVQQRWRLSRDYVYRDGFLLAAITPNETLHFSLDHLGTPRVITDANKIRVGLHYYLPFGEEWLTEAQQTDGEPMKYTGHERDSDVAGGTAAVDYMHARYYAARMGRFLSVDPILSRRRALLAPQLWNRYAYSLNSPLKFVDPDGRFVRLSGCQFDTENAKCREQQELVRQAFGNSWSEVSEYLEFGDGGMLILSGITAQEFGERFGVFAGGLARLIESAVFFTATTGDVPALDKYMGGAWTCFGDCGGGPGRPTNEIHVNPKMFPARMGGIDMTATEAFVHEVGHAVTKLFPDFAATISRRAWNGSADFVAEGYATNFESQWRVGMGLGPRPSYRQWGDYTYLGSIKMFPDE